MSAELLLNITPFETRIARVENGRVEELYIEREQERGLRGNIYKGRVQRVLPGIQAAFVDIGMERAGFLYVNDIATTETDLNTKDEEETVLPDVQETQPAIRQQPDIASLIKDGQKIPVQVSKDPISSKGPRLTSLLSLAGRYLVYLPHYDHIGIAHRIENQEERERLLEIGKKIKPDVGGLIIRTVAEGHQQVDLQQDIAFLLRLWKDVAQRMEVAAPATLVHQELNLYLRMMRDFVDDDVEKIHVDSREAYERMKGFAGQFMPEVSDRLYYYPGERPIFDVYGIEKEVNGALQRRVDLKSGGYIIIDQTEALIAIDVNSGSFVASRSLEETSFKTNLEASHEIVHQLRLRNLGGIIVVDFIDMQEEENRRRLMEVLTEAITKDKTRIHIIQFTTLGLVEMTRKRTRDSLGRMLLHECPHCHGIGHIKSPTTICYQMFREVVAESRAYPCNKLMVIAHPDIIELLLGEESRRVAELEQFLHKEISLKSDDTLPPEHYEVVLL